MGRLKNILSSDSNRSKKINSSLLVIAISHNLFHEVAEILDKFSGDWFDYFIISKQQVDAILGVFIRCNVEENDFLQVKDLITKYINVIESCYSPETLLNYEEIRNLLNL